MTMSLPRLAPAAAFAALAVLGSHVRPAAQEPEPPPPTFRADINFVRVDVIVTDRQGRQVGDLSQQDFEVLEDGKPQTIQTFKLIDVNAGAATVVEPPRQIRSAIDEQAEAAKDDVRLFAVFLDDYHVRKENSVQAREPIARFVENQLLPTDMAGIMYPLTPLDSVLLTRDRNATAAAIRSFTGRKYDYTARNIFEERYVDYVPTIEAERIRNQVTLSALKGLIVHLGGLREGRKAIVFVSEGFTNNLPPQMQDAVAGQPDPIARTLDPIGGRTTEEVSRDFFLKTDMLADIRAVYELANKYNTTIYAVDPRGLAPYEFDLSRPSVAASADEAVLGDTKDTLRILAAETDGRAILNRNDLDNGLKQIVGDSSAYYLLGYTSTQNGADGKFHEISVRVKRPNVQVRARKGYLALLPSEVERSLAPRKPGPPAAVAAALGSLAVSSRRSLIRTWVGTSPGGNGKTRVTFVWEPVPPPPGVRSEIPARVSLTAGSPDSDLYFRGQAGAPPAAAAGQPAPARVEFDAPPGPMDLDIVIQDAEAQVLDRDTRRLTVPASGPGLTLGTPQVFRAATLRDWQAIAANPDAVPVPGREFRRADRLLVRVRAQSASGAAAITARLLNHEGDPMSELSAVPADAGDVTNVDAPLAALPPGEFLIEITASDGAEQTSALVAFRVGG